MNSEPASGRPDGIPELPPRILVDSRNEKLAARVRESLAHPLAGTFCDAIQRLAAVAAGIGGSVRIGLDSAPLSFGFAVLQADGSAWIVGGLLFHGDHDRGGDGGAPTFAVSVQPSEGWTLHTYRWHRWSPGTRTTRCRACASRSRHSTKSSTGCPGMVPATRSQTG